MPTVYVNIGSNSGDRHALIEQAVAAIALEFPDAEIRRSDYIETEPWGFSSENMFLNLGLAISIVNAGNDITSFGLSMLRTLRKIEKGIDPSPHRDATGNYVDRAIDIDIIAIDDAVIETPELTVPHPMMHRRDFVLLPMLQLAPGWRHPKLGNVYHKA